MVKIGKKYKKVMENVEIGKKYTIEEAVALLPKVSTSKFDGTAEIAIKTFANPKYNDQLIRATTILPHGTGKKIIVAVYCGEEGADEAKKAGADIVGKEEIIQKIEAGQCNFDVLITTPDLIRDLAKVAKVLGPKGLMPSPKAGTVSPQISKTVSEFKKGKIEFKLDKTGNIHVPVGKISFKSEQLIENIKSLLQAIEENKPVGIKGKVIKKIVLAPTMGPGLNIIEG